MFNEKDIDLFTIDVSSFEYSKNVESHLMKAKLLPINGISQGVINMLEVNKYHSGQKIPFGVASIKKEQVHLLINCVKKVSLLDFKLRNGFKKLFTSNPLEAAILLRRALNFFDGENLYVEKLIETLSKKPELCLCTTALYRVDGLNGGDKIVINELNANPIGGLWLGTLALEIGELKNSFGIRNVLGIITKKIDDYTKNGGAYFHPVRTLDGPSSYSEKFILREHFKTEGKKFFMGQLDSLILKKDGVFVKWQNKNYKIDYIGGLSSPEVFERKPDILNYVADGKVNCPSIINNIIGLCNKAMFTLITDMREKLIDPAQLEFTEEDLYSNNPIPKTYWLLSKNNIDRTALFKNTNMVAKPVDGVGANGIFFSKDHEIIEKFEGKLKLRYLIQDYYNPVQIKSNHSSITHGSIDPYFTFDGEKGIISGVLVRSAKQGLFPSLTANSKLCTKENKDPGYLFSVGVIS